MSTSEFHRVRVRSFICLINTSILDIWSISDCQLWLQIGNLFTDNLGLFMVQTSEPNLLQLIRQCVEINYWVTPHLVLSRMHIILPIP